MPNESSPTSIFNDAKHEGPSTSLFGMNEIMKARPRPMRHQGPQSPHYRHSSLVTGPRPEEVLTTLTTEGQKPP